MNWEKLIEAEKVLGLHDRANLALRVKWADEIRKAVAPRCPKNRLGTPLISDVDVALATLSERMQALTKLITPNYDKKNKLEPNK
jgi:hypothetical protein